MPVCSNCFIEIEPSKIVLHERFCSQNMKYCSTCKEAFPKEEFEEHLANHLSRKPSQLSQEEKNIETLKRCYSSKVACEFCGLFLNYNDLVEHEEMCGARTTQCGICKKNMLYRDLKNHMKTKHNIVANNNMTSELDYFNVNNNNNNNKNNDNNNNGNNNENFKKMTSSEIRQIKEDEEFARALAESLNDQ